MIENTASTPEYSLSLAKKALVASVVILFLGTLFLKTRPFCAQVSAFCEAASTNTFEDEQIAPQYFHFSEARLEEDLKAEKIIVLYFHAPWCTTCTSFDEELRTKNNSLPENVEILQIPYDTATDLKRKYKVSYQHTLVLLDQSGEIKEEWIGGDLASLVSYLKK